MLTNIKKSKRRRYIRYAIELEALLVIDKSIKVQCIIQDFCTGGFFLGFIQPNSEIPLNKNIKIQFSISLESGFKKFEVVAQAVHITAAGAGVIVENMPASVFNALQDQANTGSKAIHHDHRSSTPNKLNRESFKTSFKQLLLDKLPILMGNFFESVSGRLEKANEHSECFTNSSALDDLVTTLNLSRESFVSEFCSSVIFQIDYISEINQKVEEYVNNSLSLVEKEDFEDWLNMSATIRKLNNHYEEEINKLTRELSRVFGLSKYSINNPISPAILCDSFREIILQFELSNNVKAALYNSFAQTLMGGLDYLYKESEALLLKHDSADKIVSHSVNKSAGKPLYKDHRFSDYEKVTSADNNQQQFWFSSDEPFNTHEFSETKSLQPITQVAGKLLHILNEIDAASPGIINKSLSKDRMEPVNQAYPCFSSDEVVTAISKVQKNMGSASHSHLDLNEFKNRLQNALESINSGEKSISQTDKNHLEVYGKFFETLLNDFSLSSDIKSFLEKIHLPLLALPLQGSDFLDSDSHPVRNILNQLALLEPAVKANKVIRNINIKSTVDSLVDRIAQESNTNPAIFSEVEQELDGLTKKVTKSTDLIIKRIIDSHEGQQKLEVAKRLIQQEIDKRIAGRSVPTVIPLLLEAGWQQLLVIAELNKEKNQDEKQKYLAVIDDLIFWLYEQESILNIQAISIKKTIEFIDDNLGSVCSDVFLRHKVIEELMALLLGAGTPKVRKTIETVKIPPVKPQENALIEATEDYWVNQVEQLCVGEWLTILIGSQGFEAMKLVWIGDVLQVFVFVNRDGLNKQEYSKAELVELLRSGAAVRTENLDAPLMDRATNLMLQKMHEKLIHNATHDPVTELFNRDEFVRQLKNEMNKLTDSQHILCHVEVLDFRVITNVCGIEGGEKLLKRLAQLMTDRLREYDLFARLGDKSFAILFKNCSAEEGYEQSKNLINTISDSHFQWQEKSFAISVSMGLVPFGDNCFDIHQLLQQADAASMSAERSGQGRILMFNNDDENLKRQNKLYEWMGNIDNVFSQNRLFVRCQMIASVEQEKNHHQHFEILLGVRDEEGNIIPPDHFIPAVERCQRMPEIDQWIIRNVFAWIEQNRTDFDSMDGFSINLSGQSVNSEAFLIFLKEFIESSNVPPDKLVFEITETVAAENLVFTKIFIKTIKQLGCKFSLDDFGSGYSSYSYLKNLNVDYLKIDGAFVKDMANNNADVAIVKSMNEIAHSLGLKTIAEYVENDEILAILKGIGVDYAQGYGIQKPIPLTELVIQAPSTEKFYFEDNDFWDI